jgi:hypothetical protein
MESTAVTSELAIFYLLPVHKCIFSSTYLLKQLAYCQVAFQEWLQQVQEQNL